MIKEPPIDAAGLGAAFRQDETNDVPGGFTGYLYLSDILEGCVFVQGLTSQTTLWYKSLSSARPYGWTEPVRAPRIAFSQP